MMRTPTRIGLAEPVHFLAAIWSVEVSERGHPLNARDRLIQASDADEDVDDRLCLETGNRRAADVVDTPIAQSPIVAANAVRSS